MYVKGIVIVKGDEFLKGMSFSLVRVNSSKNSYKFTQ